MIAHKAKTKDKQTRAEKRFNEWLDEVIMYHNGDKFIMLSRRTEFLNYGLL